MMSLTNRFNAVRRPVAERGLNQRQRRHAGGIGPQDSGTQGESEDIRLPQQQHGASPTAGEIVPLAPDICHDETIESVILRRGSTRQFTHEPIGFDVLSTILRYVSRDLSADVLARDASATDLYLIVNAVDTLAPGAYLFDRARDALALLRGGEFRREAGHLDLGQDLAADAAVNLYWLVDLHPPLERFGNRGYRAAQLEAAIRGGKTYLAAFALGIGATGLTFFDDEVTEFFSPHAAGKSVMFLVALGHRLAQGPA